MMMKRFLRSVIEKHLAGVARVYRLVRDELQASRTEMARMPEGFWLAGDDSMRHGDFEPQERRILARELAGVDVFVDVGANVGYYACLARSRGVRVVAIEPQPLNLRNLFRALEANRWDNVETWPVAVADRPGTLPMWGAKTGASLISGWAGTSQQYRQLVPVSTLDTLFDRRLEGQRLLVKMDIEGAEYRALLGGMSLVKRQPPPVWLVEINLGAIHPDGNSRFSDTFALFFDHGYRAMCADDHERPVSREDTARWQRAGRVDGDVYNWLFVHASDPRWEALKS
jgi:FkbM family methyltransferase